MRKLLISVVLFAMVVWAAHPLLLLEPDGTYGSTSRTYRNALPERDFKSILKNSKHISTHNWVIQYHDYNWRYYMPRPVQDTQATRFSPPTECSLVAFALIHYNTTTGQVGQPYFLFVADQRMDMDYDTFPNGSDALVRPFVSPLGPKFPGYENIMSIALPNGQWDVINVEIYIPYDSVTNKSNDFFCGYRAGTNNFAILCSDLIPWNMPYRRTVYSYRYRQGWLRWYNYGWNDGTKLELGFTAYIRALRNLPPSITPDRLPNTYSTLPRLLIVYGRDFGVPPESTGIQQAFIEYDINGIPGSPITMTLFDGNTEEGYWSGEIPGANVGDVVTYRAIAIDYQGLADTSNYWSYEIKAGTPNYGLYIKGNANAIFNDYIESTYAVDVWDIAEENGAPDQSVIEFYTPTKGPGSHVVIWKGWGETTLSYNNYGSGYARVGDTLYIAGLIDAGGFFWLEDQDGLYGLDYGIWNDYAQHNSIPNSFVHRYFGIIQATDDGAWSSTTSYDVYGDPDDPVIGSLFSGTIGYQTTEGIIRHGGMGGVFNGSREWAGSIDAYEAYVLPEMTTEDGTVLAVRQELTKTGKAVFHLFGSSFIVDPLNPTTVYDDVASNYLQDLYIDWANLGVKEPKPDVKIVEISNPRINGSEVLMTVKLPVRSNLKVLVHDITGRVLGKAFDGEAVGLKTVSYNTSKTNPGTYFLSVYVNGELKGAKKFILVK